MSAQAGIADFTYTVVRGEGGGPTVVTVAGDLDLASAPTFAPVLADAARDGGDVVVDLAHLAYTDSSGLWALLEANKAAEAAGGLLTLRSPGRNVRRIIAYARLDGILTIES
jgi:anti-sigma B factor antagonist